MTGPLAVLRCLPRVASPSYVLLGKAQGSAPSILWADIIFVCAVGRQQPTGNACDSTAGRTFPHNISCATASSERMASAMGRHRCVGYVGAFVVNPICGPEWAGRDDGLVISPGVLPLMGMASIKINLRLS